MFLTNGTLGADSRPDHCERLGGGWELAAKYFNYLLEVNTHPIFSLPSIPDKHSPKNILTPVVSNISASHLPSRSRSKPYTRSPCLSGSRDPDRAGFVQPISRVDETPRLASIAQLHFNLHSQHNAVVISSCDIRRSSRRHLVEQPSCRSRTV